MNKKGFTIIELLIAFVILFILMTGFLRGILLYMDYQINNGLKDRASEIALKMSSQIQTARFNPTAGCDRKQHKSLLVRYTIRISLQLGIRPV
jgi:type II secretory pathway pseudopilin PulG